ncbi:hypothetical protein BGX28_004770 [Mortierella sp. GBA30]|nr:hypothetical protein BGX28_004770 [Mortierella sp. GBA30]
MAPPKKSTAVQDSAANFFQRGKKPTTAQRVVTVKKTTAASVTPTVAHRKKRHQDDEGEVTDEIEEGESDVNVEESLFHSDEDEEAEEALPGEEEEEDNGVLLDDEIQSDDSDSIPVADLKKTAAQARSSLKEISVPKTVEVVKAKAKATKAIAARAKKSATASFVAPFVGDIHVGFHQADLSEEEKILRQFDLASKFGPCTDLTRLERWERAFSLGLDPPQYVKDIIVQHHGAMNTPLYEGRV